MGRQKVDTDYQGTREKRVGLMLRHERLLKDVIEAGAAPGCLLRGERQNVSLVLREPKIFAPALKRSLSGGGGGGTPTHFSDFNFFWGIS